MRTIIRNINPHPKSLSLRARDFKPLDVNYLIILFMLLLWCSDVIAQDTPIVITAETQIQASDTWQMLITIENAESGDTVDVTIFNGLQQIRETLILGTGGLARWQVEAGHITQAGESMVTVRYGNSIETLMLTVLAGRPHTIQAFTTANSIATYGAGQTSVIALVSDEYGNPVTSGRMSLVITAPDGTRRVRFLSIVDGLATARITSIGGAGMLRIRIAAYDSEARLTLIQQAGDPAQLTLDITPDCMLADGVDSVRLVATVRDEHGDPVTDGTVVQFRWVEGQGTGIIVDGQATLNMPPPQIADTYTFTAQSSTASATDELTVVDDRCR